MSMCVMYIVHTAYDILYMFAQLRAIEMNLNGSETHPLVVCFSVDAIQ